MNVRELSERLLFEIKRGNGSLPVVLRTGDGAKWQSEFSELEYVVWDSHWKKTRVVIEMDFMDRGD